MYYCELSKIEIHSHADHILIDILDEYDTTVSMLSLNQHLCANANKIDCGDIVRRIEMAENIDEVKMIVADTIEMHGIENVAERAMDICTCGDYTFKCGKSTLIIGFTPRNTLIASLVNRRGHLLDYTEYLIDETTNKIGELCTHSQYCVNHFDHEISKHVLKELITKYPTRQELIDEMELSFGVNSDRLSIMTKYNMDFKTVSKIIMGKTT